MNEEKSSANGRHQFIINRLVDEQPELISEAQLALIKFIMETPVENDEDLAELGRDCGDD